MFFYTYGSHILKQTDGYSDFSSLQQRAYREIGIEIGSDTKEPILNGEWVQLGGEFPDENKSQIGDELFFSACYDNGRLYNVGHIDMYVGNNEILGHGCKMIYDTFHM